MAVEAETVLRTFRTNVESVHALARFDEIVIEFAVQQIRAREQALHTAGKKLPERLSGERTVQALENIRAHGSLRREYEAMFNQCVVLLVSYFGSALRDLFRWFIQRRLEDGLAERFLAEELKLSFRQLVDLDWDVKSNAADLFLKESDLSFQDMKSVSRAFKRWLGFARERDQRTDNIILGQAARHAIVHAGAMVDDRLLHQVRGARQRTLKLDLELGTPVVFTPEEIEVLAEEMQTYLHELRDGISAAG